MSSRWANCGVTPDVIATRQKGADAFRRLLALDKPTDVAKFSDKRFNDALSKVPTKLTTQ